MMKFNQIKKKIDRKPIIIFDLFDTLIKRVCYKPMELFRFIEQKIDKDCGGNSHFAAIRIHACWFVKHMLHRA